MSLVTEPTLGELLSAVERQLLTGAEVRKMLGLDQESGVDKDATIKDLRGQLDKKESERANAYSAGYAAGQMAEWVKPKVQPAPIYPNGVYPYARPWITC